MNPLDRLRRLGERHASRSFETAIPGLRIGRLLSAPKSLPMLYEPMICLVLAGSKRIFSGRDIVDYGEGQLLLSAADLPVNVQFQIDAQRGYYMALVLRLDPLAVADLAMEMGIPAMHRHPGNFAITESDPLLLDAWRRLCELLERPEEIPFLASGIEREILFRLLRGPRGHVLAEVATADPQVRQVRGTAAWIRANYAEHVSIEQLAHKASMSITVFHRRFKQVLGMSPLQYQKTIRLHEARGRITAAMRDTASIAYAVGYGSTSQFSREYKRMFGASPSHDLARTSLRSV
ncbi:AraC-like DNA-binding protein [Luteibacter jiangsuensis]|uniref:AraC-like DNA-binding protein n=1 Tax=Luteibacter jiangsuensis TaxID=637577 RepID=A0ABT9SVR4_9GAMM|nr:AraC family transcriptional regulator [Luteibacter jiangsuensis]MDQ0009095.1 AraC-like DNA-binding protein [Luteibacter jiangsuensis]